MGTRSLIVFLDDDGSQLCVMYRQFDGYPTGLGQELFVMLNGKTLVNGYSDPDTQLNGMGCLAAFVISKLKEGCGNVYIKKPGTIDVGEEYIYEISPSKNHAAGKINLKLTSCYGDKVLYDGDINEFDAEKCQEEDD